MNILDDFYISRVFSETYKEIGFPVLVYKSTAIADKFNQVKVSLVPALEVVYAVVAAEKFRDSDLAREDDREGDTEEKMRFKFVRRDLFAVGVDKLEVGDILEVTISGEISRWVITGFLDRLELPNIFVRPIATLQRDVNVRVVQNV